MITQYTLETLDELIDEINKSGKTDGIVNRPNVTGVLNVVERDVDSHWIVLNSDPIYRFEIPLKEYIVQLSKLNGLNLYSQDCIPK